MDNRLEDGESLMLKRLLVKIEKQAHEQSQRKSMFITRCKSQGKCHKMVIVLIIGFHRDGREVGIEEDETSHSL